MQPLRAKQAAEAARIAAEAAAKAEADKQAADAQQALVAAQNTPKVYYPGTSAGSPLIAGSMGYISGMGNCVDFARQFGKNQPGNPISWRVSTMTPFVGAAVLFPFNHVGIVTGIHSDGSIEVAHANCPGCSTHYSMSQVRGFF